VCLRLNATPGSACGWHLWIDGSDGNGTIASGELPAADLTQWHTLSMSFGGDGRVSGLVDGAVVGEGPVGTAVVGMVGLVSGYHEAEFDEFAMA
jgi:hypothetical protein